MALNIAASFPGKSVAPSAAYPFGSAQDVTTPGAGDGTPLVADIYNDLFGMQQSFLAAAGLTANGSPDSVTNSQYLDAILILTLGALSAPTGADNIGVSGSGSVQEALDALQVGQTGGLIVFTTKALLDAFTPSGSPEEESSYKVTNDASSANNGFYNWNGASFDKDASLVLNAIDRDNTSDGVSGFAVEHDIARAKVIAGSKQLLDYESRVLDTIVQADGNITANGSWDTSGYIRVQPNTEYFCNQVNGTSKLAFSYDENLNPIATGHITQVFTTEGNAHYLVFTIGPTANNAVFGLNSDGTDYSVFKEKLSAEVDVNSSMGDDLNSCNDSIGEWIPFNGAGVVFNTDQVDITTVAGTFRGMKNDKLLSVATEYFVEFEAKISAGNVQDWFLTNTSVGIPQELITGLTGEYQRFTLKISNPTAGNKNFLFYQNFDESGNTLSIRNFWYYDSKSQTKNTYDKINELVQINEQGIDAVLDETNSGNFKLGQWTVFQGSGTAIFDTDHLEITTAASSFSGIKNAMLLTEGQEYFVEFEARVSAGNIHDWFVTNSSIGVESERIEGLTSEYQRFYIKIENPTAGNKQFTFFQSIIEAGNTLEIKNFWYYDRNSWFKSTSNSIDQNAISLLEKIQVNDVTGSVDSTILENEISDLLRPDRKGKIEFKTTDLVPSINNMGTGYLFDDGGTIELRVVKDPTEIVGVALATKVTNSITPVSFTISYFGDSITLGTGATTGYTDRTDTLLTSDGHTITTSTNNGKSGFDALELTGYVDGLTPVAHDIAVLMIGINDIEHWITNSIYPGVIGDIKPREFREWYKANLASLITSIINYSSYTKLFLVIPTPQRIVEPSFPSADRVAADPLMQIVIQECIEQYTDNLDTIHLCRGDYYLKDPTAGNIPDGIHPNDTGAEELAQGVRDEITFRV